MVSSCLGGFILLLSIINDKCNHKIKDVEPYNSEKCNHKIKEDVYGNKLKRLKGTYIHINR